MIGAPSATTIRGQPIAYESRTPEEALHALLEECERCLFGYLLRIVHDADIAQDVAQETFIRAHQALQRGQQVTRPWVFRVAHNRAIDELRHSKYTRPDIPALESQPVHDSTDLSLAVRETMDRLDPLDRQVLHLFVVEGFKTDEIGDMLGVRGAAVRQRLYRARERFRRLYGEAA